ncbi:hypothetical protein [Nonomuraea glycinis]|uniref:hypothetical protein n=1 Tax=Nonomuraea glycinis TaxID=2047744 RepID=UPI0033B81EE2
MPKRRDPTPAYGALITLIAEMRPDWDLDQITAEIIGCPWSEHLAIAAIQATREDDDRLRVADAILRIPTHRIPVTREQHDAYLSYARSRLRRKDTQ